MEPFFILGGVLSVIGVGIYLAYLYEKKRTEAMQQFAEAKGWQFERNGEGRLQEIQHFKLFGLGHSRKLSNVMRGAKDRTEVSVADYKYVTGSGKSSQTYNQTVCAVRVPGMTLPHFFARRQVPLFDSLGKLLGGQDINFEEDPAFSKAYVLQTQGDEASLRRYFNDRARTAFTELASKSPQMEGQGDVLLLHFGRRLSVEQLDGLIADAVNLVRTWSPG
jgi:hypothetical protein